MLKQILLLRIVAVVILSAVCCYYSVTTYSETIGKAVLGICSTRTNLSYPAICGPIDAKWFGVRVLSVGLALEFNAEVHPLLTTELLPSVEQRMRAAASHSYRASNMDLDKAIIHMTREQRTGLRTVSAALDEASERLVSRPQIVRFVTDSVYNAFWMQGEGVEGITPETWAFVTRVLNSLKKEWLRHAEEALDGVRADLSRRDADIYVNVLSNKKQSPPMATLYGRMASLSSYVLVVRENDSSSARKGGTATTHFEYELTSSDKLLSFGAEMVMLLGSVRVLAAFA